MSERLDFRLEAKNCKDMGRLLKESVVLKEDSDGAENPRQFEHEKSVDDAIRGWDEKSTWRRCERTK